MTGSVWHTEVKGAWYYLGFIFLSLVIVSPASQKLLLAGTSLALLMIGIMSAGTLALHDGLRWMLVGTPAAYLLLVCVGWSRTGIVSWSRRIALWLAVALLLAAVYVADITGFWWQLIVVSLVLLGGLLAFKRFLPGLQGLPVRLWWVVYGLSGFVILMALGVAVYSLLLPQERVLGAGVYAAIIVGMVAGIASLGMRFSFCVTLWSALVCLILVSALMISWLQHGAAWEALAACGAILLTCTAIMLARKATLPAV